MGKANTLKYSVSIETRRAQCCCLFIQALRLLWTCSTKLERVW